MKYNILVTLDSNYLEQLAVMLWSFSVADPEAEIDVYVLNSTLTDADFARLSGWLHDRRVVCHDIKIDRSVLADAPITDRYPQEIYYRIFAARYLPRDLDRVLYLDPDIVILRPLRELYNMPLDGCYFAASTHVRNRMLTLFNRIRLGIRHREGKYINSGVMVINLALLRAEQDEKEVFDYIRRKKNVLLLPDQDVISAVYTERLAFFDPYIYNMTERMLSPLPPKKIDLDWVRGNSAVVHYLGRNKPWKPGYHGTLGVLYRDFHRAMTQGAEQ